MQDLIESPFSNELSPVFASSRAQIQNAIRCAHDVGIMLHHQDRVPEVAQILQDFDQPMSVRGCSPMEGSSNTYRCPQGANPAKWPAESSAPPRRDSVDDSRSRVRYSNPDFIQKSKPLANLLQELFGDLGLLSGQFQILEKLQRVFHG